MVEGKFYDKIDDALLKFAVIVAKSNGRLIFCKHRERDTYEVPDIEPICVYSVKGRTRENEDPNDETFGMLFGANFFRGFLWKQ